VVGDVILLIKSIDFDFAIQLYENYHSLHEERVKGKKHHAKNNPVKPY